jgi:LysR family transcriptional activator of nhaA
MESMDWLNYHHLFYFWTVAREGSITAASEKLLLSPATISAQIRELETALGQKLFERSGRGLSLTEVGQMAYRYAGEIFALGRELVDSLQGPSLPRAIKVRIGINDVIPKLIAYQLIAPLFHSPQRLRVECVQGTPEQLLPALAVHDLDLVLSDAPVHPQIRVRAYSHLLGESPIRIYAAPRLAGRLSPGFPGSLDQAPALLPAAGSALRNVMDKWFESVHIRPHIIGEFEDVTLMSMCGEHGQGFFAGHGVIERQIRRSFGVKPLGTLTGYRGSFYAISVERRIRSPAVAAIADAARRQLSSCK